MQWHLTHTASCPSTYAKYYPKADSSYRQYKSWQDQAMIMSSAMVEWENNENTNVEANKYRPIMHVCFVN